MGKKKNRGKKAGAKVATPKPEEAKKSVVEVVEEPKPQEVKKSEDIKPPHHTDGGNPLMCPIASKLQNNAAFMQQFESAVMAKASEQQKTVTEVVTTTVETVVDDPELQNRLDSLEEENKAMSLKTKKLEGSLSEVKASLASVTKERDALKSQQQTDTSEETIASLKRENKELQEKASQYQSVLDSTEKLLNTLQCSVESEESTWKVVVQQKEEELIALKKQNEELQQQAKQSPATDLPKILSELEELKKEKSDLEDKLNALQKEKNAESCQLRDLVMLGQESSKEQEELISQLQTELQQVKSTTTNGPNTDSLCTSMVSLTSSEASASLSINNNNNKKKNKKKNFLSNLLHRKTGQESGSKE